MVILLSKICAKLKSEKPRNISTPANRGSRRDSPGQKKECE
jgi:hypothetical protein